MAKCFVVIPARGGSKGVIGKNLRKVRGKSLIVRSMIHAQEIVEGRNIVLSTDSHEMIREVAEVFKIERYSLESNKLNEFGPFWLHFRDELLSADETLITEVLLSIRDLLIELKMNFDLMCLLQPTSPFRNINELMKIKNFIQNEGSKITSMVSVRQVEDIHPARMYHRLKNGKLKPLQGFTEFRGARRQDLPEIYIRDGGFYLIGDDLISSRLQYSDSPISFERVFPWTINIDGPSDLLLAQVVASEELILDPNEGLK
jgi:CMP-N-acetylneuraminic acid synthetase